MILKVTPAQLEALKRIVDDVDAMIGCGEACSDQAWAHNVRLLDSMLKNNGVKRYFKEGDEE